VLLGAEGERVDVDTSVGVAGVVLERLNEVEVSSFALREAILTVKLELSGNNRVLTPAVHLEGSLRKDEGASIRNTVIDGIAERGREVGNLGGRKITYGVNKTTGSSVSEKSIGIYNRSVCGTILDLCGRGESTYRVGESINGIGVVERLGTEGGVEDLGFYERIAVADIGVRLDNPDNLLTWVVEIELDLVTGRSNGFGASELKLLNEVLVGVLSHASALVGIEENVINVERSSYERLRVSTSGFDVLVGGGTNLGNSEKALVHRADLDVNLDLMVLKSNEGKSKTGVAAEPELKGNVERGLRESLAGGADRVGDIGTGASSGDLSEILVGKVGKLCGITNHLVETVLLFGSKSKLVPDVHPVTVLSVDALTTDLNLNHRDELVSGVVEPSGIDITSVIRLVNLGESNLKVCSVSQVTVS